MYLFFKASRCSSIIHGDPDQKAQSQNAVIQLFLLNPALGRQTNEHSGEQSSPPTPLVLRFPAPHISNLLALTL